MNRRRSRRIFPPHTKYQIKWTCKKSAFSLRKEGKRAFCRPRRDAVFSVSRRAKPFRKTRRRRRQSYFLSHGATFSRPLLPHGVSSLAGNICSPWSVFAPHEITDTGRKHIPKLRYRRDHRIRDGHRISDGKKQNE